MSKATREQVKAALDKYIEAKDAVVRRSLTATTLLENSREWHQLGIAYEELQATERAFNSLAA